MTIPTLVIETPIWANETPNKYQNIHPDTITDYARRRNRRTGNDEAILTITTTPELAQNAPANLLGLHFRENTPGQTPYTGYIRAVTIDYLGYTVTSSIKDTRTRVRAAYSELIKNGNLEDNSGGTPGWTASGPGTMSLDTGSKLKDANCLKTDATGVASSSAYQNITVVPLQTYKLHVVTRGDGTYSGRISIWNWTATTVMISNKNTNITGTSGEGFELEFTVPAACTDVRIYLTAPASGVIYWDDISVKRQVGGEDTISYTAWQTANVEAYGQRDLTIKASDADPSTAATLAAEELALRQEPTITSTMSATGGDDPETAQLTITIAGYHDAMTVREFDDGTDRVEQNISSLLTAINNSFVYQDLTLAIQTDIDTTVQITEDKPETVAEILNIVMPKGTTLNQQGTTLTIRPDTDQPIYRKRDRQSQQYLSTSLSATTPLDPYNLPITLSLQDRDLLRLGVDSIKLDTYTATPEGIEYA